jgi:hypothetical protein
MKKKWTPGPWVAECSAHPDFSHTVGSDYDSVCAAFNADDAQLIAAAPDLYEALERVMLNGIDDNNIGMVASALSKARGE